LSEEIGDEWTKIAEKLGHDIASIQRIVQTYAFLEGTHEATRYCIKQMLVDWFKASELSKHKVTDLCRALSEGGRPDLAEDLANRDRELRADNEKKLKELLLERCVKAYSESKSARKIWRSVAKALGLSADDIASISGSSSVKEISLEQAKEMFTRWQELHGDSATKDSLVVVLQKLQLSEAAVNVSMVR